MLNGADHCHAVTPDPAPLLYKDADAKFLHIARRAPKREWGALKNLIDETSGAAIRRRRFQKCNESRQVRCVCYRAEERDREKIPSYVELQSTGVTSSGTGIARVDPLTD